MNASPPVVALIGSGAVYVVALGLAPWLPAAALAAAAAAAGGVLMLGYHRAARWAMPAFPPAAWFPLHLLLLATGGTASSLLPLIVPWLVLVAVRGTFTRALYVGLLGAGLLVGAQAWVADVVLTGAAEAVVVSAAGLAPAWLIDRLRHSTSDQVRTLERILAEAGTEGTGDARVDAARRLDTLGDVLERVRRNLDANRATLWDVDADGETARPWLAKGGGLPAAVGLVGDPLHWAWEEGLPLQLEAPDWSEESAVACAVPIEPRGTHASLLTLEFEDGQTTATPDELEDAAARLRTLILTQKQQARAVARRRYFDRALELLRRLPRHSEPKAFADALAESTAMLVDGTGAAVAAWDGGSGVVLASVGRDGGPGVGAEFTPDESELGLAARTGRPVLREDRRPGQSALPLANTRERWFAEPRALAVFPLPQPEQDAVSGVLAVWSADAPSFEPQALDVLDAVRPYVALQLHQLQALQALQKHIDRDPLTRLPNRRAFKDRLRSESTRFDRYRRPLAMLMLDVDHFKSINDTYGHEAGDEVLRRVAGTIDDTIRGADFPARYGGEEFVVLLPETRLQAARDAAERLRRAIEETAVRWNGEEITVRASVGVSACPECVDHPSGMVGSADAMLYESKECGRNRVTAAARSGE